MTSTDTDKITKQIILKAPRSRVWRAISDARQFGEWFGVEINGSFEAGAHVSGSHKGEEYGRCSEIDVEQVEPQRLLSFRWVPYSIEPGVDLSKESKTLVVFELEEVPEGTRLTVVESGFDAVPIERRAKAFAENTEGWQIQMAQIEAYLASAV